MFAREAHAGGAAELVQHCRVVRDYDGLLIHQVWVGHFRPRGQIMRDLCQEPGAAIAAAPNHDTVGAGHPQGGGGVVLCQNVAIDDHRKAGRLFHIGHESPVRSAGVKLLPGASMHRHHPDAGFPRDPRQGWGVEALVVPAHAHFQRDRHIDGVHRGLQDRGGGDLVAHQSRARHLADSDLFHRAAEVDVDQIGAFVHGNARRLRHRNRVAPRQLHRGYAACAIDLGHGQRFRVLADHCPGGNHFRDNHAGAKRFGDPAKWQVGDAGHRRQDDRGIDANPAPKGDWYEGRKIVFRTEAAYHLGKLARGGAMRNGAMSTSPLDPRGPREHTPSES